MTRFNPSGDFFFCVSGDSFRSDMTFWNIDSPGVFTTRKKRSAGSEDPADFERGQSLQGTKQYKPAVSQGIHELQVTKCAGGEKKL